MTESKSFQAETGGAGEVVVEFNIDTTTIQGKKIVVFEKLYRDEEKHGDGRELAKHEDWDDEGQNLEIKVAKIGTVAKDKNDGDNIIFPDKEQTIVDTVEYINLMKGTEYTMVGTVMVKETGEALEINGEKITVRKTFISSETGAERLNWSLGLTQRIFLEWSLLCLRGYIEGNRRKFRRRFMRISMTIVNILRLGRESGRRRLIIWMETIRLESGML